MTSGKAARARRRWTAPGLVRVRTEMAQASRDGARRLRAMPGTGPAQMATADAVEREANLIRQASMWWVTSDMAAVAMDAARTLDPWIPRQARPDPVGLLVWDGGLGPAEWTAPDDTPVETLVDGVAWWTPSDQPDRLAIQVLTRPEQIRDHLAPGWRDKPLFAVRTILLPVARPTDEISDRLPGWADGLISCLGATWLLMDQPMLVSQRPSDREPRRHGGRRPGESDLDADPVRVIDLRVRRVDDPAPANGDGDGRTYRHRWVVSGHWRQQAHGTGRSERRRQWIAPYVKGKDGAPLIVATRVHRWRR